MKPKKLAETVAEAASNLKAKDIKGYDLEKLCSFTDFFVICSGTSDRHVQSIADNIVEELKKKKYSPIGVEGYDGGEWVLIDYGSVVAHVFRPASRDFYNIERLWGDAKKLSLKV